MNRSLLQLSIAGLLVVANGCGSSQADNAATAEPTTQTNVSVSAVPPPVTPVPAVNAEITTSTATGNQAPTANAFFALYADAFASADLTTYRDLAELVKKADTIAVVTFTSVERGRTVAPNPNVPPLEFAQFTVKVEQTLKGDPATAAIPLEFPIVPFETPEIKELRARTIDQEAVDAAKTDEEVAAAVDQKALDEGLAKLYQPSIDASVEFMRSNLPTGTYLVFMVDSEPYGGQSGSFQLVSPADGLVANEAGKAALPLSGATVVEGTVEFEITSSDFASLVKRIASIAKGG